MRRLSVATSLIVLCFRSERSRRAHSNARYWMRGLPGFAPDWVPPDEGFSDWHYLIVDPDPDPALADKPVVILMNNGNFSASDIFLSGLKDRGACHSPWDCKFWWLGPEKRTHSSQLRLGREPSNAGLVPGSQQPPLRWCGHRSRSRDGTRARILH